MAKQTRVTRKYLAELYGWSQGTITRKLKAIGINHSKKLSELDINLIYDLIGIPEQTEIAAKMLNSET